MALIHRVSNLFRADLNAVLDHIEEPELLLKQAVRDMEDELEACERRITSCEQEQETLEARRQQLGKSVCQWDEQLDLCFQSGKDDLARSIVRKKLGAERLIQRLEERTERNGHRLGQERRSLEENRATLEGLRQKADLFINQSHGASSEAGDFARMARELRVDDDEVEVAFLREKASRSAS